jgi:hypothetical protein
VTGAHEGDKGGWDGARDTTLEKEELLLGDYLINESLIMLFDIFHCELKLFTAATGTRSISIVGDGINPSVNGIYGVFLSGFGIIWLD